MTSRHAELGLRERKKARTHDAIQRHALRLFDQYGYAETTVEQVAEAAEVSPSTFFRYFPTKEDTVLYDRIDPVMIASFHRQPPDRTPLQAVRASLREVTAQLPADESEMETIRHRLIFTAPELRPRVMERVVDTMALLADAVAQRVGLDRDDRRVQVFTGCVLGAVIAEAYGGIAENDPLPVMSDELMDRIDAALAMLEGGLPFEHGADS